MLTPNRRSPIHMPQTPSVHSPARASPFITVEQKMTMIVMAMEIERLHKILLSKRNYYESKIEEFTTRIHTFKEQTTQQEILIHQLKEQLNQKTIHIGQIIQEKSSEQINNHLNVQLNQLNQQLQSQSQQMNSLQMENQNLKKQYDDAPSLRKRIYELDQTYSKLIFEKNEEIKALKTRIPTLIDQTNQVQLINQLLEQREQELLQWQHSQQQVDLTHDNQRLTNEIKFLNEKLNLVLYENEQLKLKKQEKINIQLTATPPNNDEIKLNSQQVQTPPQLSHRSISPSYMVNTQQRNVINNQRIIHTNILNIPQTQFNVYTPQRLITSTASYQQQQQNASFVDIQLISRNQKSLSPSSQQSAPKYYSPQVRRTSIENAQEFNQLLKKLQLIQNQGHFTQIIIESQIKIIATLLHLKKLELPPQAIPTMSYTAIYQANSVERERSTVRYQQCVSPNRTHLVPPTQAIYINNSQARIKTIPSQHQIVGPSILIKSRSISASSIKERQSQNDLQIILRQVEDSYQKKLQEANQRIQTLIQENQLLQQQSQSQEQKWQLTMQEKYTEALAQLNYFENQIKLQKNSFDTQMQTYQRTSQEQYQLKINQLTQQLQQQQTEITTLKNTLQQLINQSQNGQQSDEIQHLKQLILQIESDYESKISQLNQNNSQSNNQYLNEQLISELQDKIKELEAQLIYEKQQTHLLKEEFSKQSIHMKDELQRSLQLTSQCERLKVQSDQLSIQNIQSQKTISTLQQQIKQQSSGQVTESQMRKMEQNLNFLQEQLNTQQNQLQQEKQINQQLKSKFDQQVQQIKLQQQTMQQTNLQCKQLSEELQLKQQTIDQQVLIIQQNTEQITVLRQTINTNSQFYKDTQNNGQLLEIQIENLKKQLFDQSQSLQQNQEALRNTQKQYSILLTESKQNKQQFMDLRAKYEEEISKLNQTYQTQITQLQVQITETRTIEEKRSQENIELKSSNQQGQNDQTEQINELKNQLISQRKAFDQEIQQNMNQLNQLRLVNSQLQQQLINSDNDMLSAKAKIQSLSNELQDQQLLYNNMQQKYEEEILNIKQAYQTRISEMQVSITETRTIQERQNSSYRHTQESKYMQDLETLKTENLRLQQYQIDQTEQIQQLKQQLITQLEAFDLEKQQIVHKLVSEIEEKDRQNTTHTYVELTEIQNYKTQLNQYQQVNSTLQIQITNYENDMLQAKAQIESLRNDLQAQQLLYNNLQQKYEEEISKIKQAYQTQITDMQVSITESRTVSQRQSSSYRRSQESKYQQDLQSLQTENLKLQQSIQQGQHDQAQQINELKNQLISQREAFDLERQQIVDKLVREIEEKDKQYESKLKVELVEIQNYKNQLNQLRSENSQLQQQLINSDNDMLSAKAKIQSLSNELQDQQLLYNNMQQKYEEEISNIKQANQTRISEMQVSITETRTIQERQSSSYHRSYESKYQQNLQSLQTENLNLQQSIQQGQNDQAGQINELKNQLMFQSDAFDLERQQIVDKLVREIEEKDKELLQIQQQYQQLQFDNQELIISQNNELELLRQELHDQREGSDNQLHQQIAKLVAEIEAQDAEILQLKQQLKQLPQLESQLYTQNEKLSNQQKQNDQQKSILLQLQQQIKTQEDQIRGLLLQQQDMNKENENERKRLQEENLRLTQSMMDLQKQAQNNSKDIENYQLQQQLYIFQVQINELQKQNQEVQIKYEKTLELYNKLQGQFKLTQDKLFQMESDYQLLEQQDEYEKQHLTTQLQQLQGQLDQSRTIEQLLNKQLSEAELKINKLAHENKSLKKSSVEIHEEGSDIDRNSLYRNLGEQLKTTQQQLSQSEYEADELKRSLNNQIDQLSQKLNLANSQISNLNQQQNLNLQDKQGQINQLKNELNIANARLQELLNLEQEYQLKISRLSDLDQQIYQERESKQQLIQQQQNEIRKYKVEIDNLSNQLTNQSSNSLEEIHKLKIQIRQQESQLRQLNYDKQDLQIQLDTEKKIYQDKLENLNELLSQTNNDSLNFDKSLIQKQNQELLELQRKFDNLQENNLKNQYSSENNIKLQSQISQQAAEIDKLQNYANSLESDKQNQLQQINKLKYQIENLESRQSETKSQYLSLNETLQTYQAQNVKYEQILIQKDHEINKMKFQIQDLIAQSNQDETLIRELKAKIQLLEGQIILIEENQQNMQQTYINQYSLKIDEMNLDLVNKIERLKQQLAEEQDQHLNETRDLQHQLNKYTIQIRTLEDKIRSLEYELETSKSDQNNVVIEKIIDNDYDIENQQLRQQLGILKQKYDDLFFNQSYQAERDVQLRRLDDQIQILYQQIQQQSNDHKQKLAQIDKEHSFQILQYQEKIKDLEDKYGLQLGNDKSLLLENQELANQIKYLSEDLTLQRTLLQQLKDKPKEIIVNRFENSPRGQSELMALTRQNQEQEIIIQQLNSKISQIEQENKSLIQANQELQLAANKFQQDFDNLQRQIRDYKNEIEVLKQQNQRLVNNQQQQQYQYQQQQQQQDQQLQSLQQQQQQNQQQFQQNTINEDEFNLQKQQIKLLKQQVNDKNNEIDQLVNQLQQTRQSQRKEQLLVSPQTLHQSQSSQDLQQSRNYEDLALYFPNGMKKIVFQTPQNKLKSSKIESQTDLHILQQNEKELRKQVEIWKRKYEKLLQTQYSYSHTPDKKTTQQHESTAQQNEELRIWQKKYNELLNQQSSINTDKDLYQLKSLNQKLLSDLQQTQVESQQKIKQLQHDLDESFQVQCSLNDIEFKNRQYQTELARMQQQLDQVSNLNKQIMDDNYKLKSNLQNNTQNQKKNESEYSSDLINELNLYKSQNENLRKQVAQLKEMQSKQQQEITTLTYSVEERTNKFGNNQQIISENDNLRKQVQELRDQLNKQQQEARFQQGTLIEESQRYKSQLENTRKQMNDSNSLISSLQFELNTLKNRNESNMQNQNDIYIKQIESLRAQLDSQSIYRKENDQLKNQLLEQKDLKQQLQDEINYLRKEKEQNQSKVQTDQLRNQLIEQNEHISKLQSELILLKSQLESSQFNDINRQKPQLDNLRQQLSDSVQVQQRMESELVTMRTQYDTIKFSMNSKEMELNQLKTKLRVLESQTQYQDKAQFYEDKIQQLQQEINKLQNSEKELLNQLQFWKEKVYTLKTTINKIEKEVINLNEIINQLLQGEPQQSKQIKNQQTRTDYTYMDNKQTEQNRQSWI